MRLQLVAACVRKMEGTECEDKFQYNEDGESSTDW